jgi:predicted nucleic acid-binding protein
VIVATAIHHRLPLATRDRAIVNAALVETIW